MEITKEVLAGIARLDERGPGGWRSMVDPDALECDDPFRCVLSQVFGGYRDGMVALGLTEHTGPDDVWDHGFVSRNHTEHWKQALA